MFLFFFFPPSVFPLYSWSSWRIHVSCWLLSFWSSEAFSLRHLWSRSGSDHRRFHQISFRDQYRSRSYGLLPGSLHSGKHREHRRPVPHFKNSPLRPQPSDSHSSCRADNRSLDHKAHSWTNRSILVRSNFGCVSLKLNLILSLFSLFHFRSWLYWLVIIESMIAMPLIGTFARETNPTVVYRRGVLKLRRITGAWTPEPRYEPYIGALLRRHAPLPFIVLFTHPVVAISTISSTFFLGTFALVVNGVQQMWIQSHGFSQDGALRVSTVCYSLGALFAICVFLAIVLWKTSSDEKKGRPLLLDEKGFVGAKALVCQPERSLKLVVASGALFMICKS